jgi:hypothetical protein
VQRWRREAGSEPKEDLAPDPGRETARCASERKPLSDS